MVAAFQAVQHELVLLAAVGIAVLGAEDFLFDLTWFALRRSRRRDVRPPVDGTIAIFVPAWRESRILPATLDRMLAVWRGEDIRIYIGCYPNDAATLFAVSQRVAAHAQLRLVIADRDGPSSKADNLNHMWRAMGADERAEGHRFAAVVLHDAEDQVHAAEIALFRRELPGAAMVQIPVEPVLTHRTGVIAAHYADEFAEAHGKEMPLRAALSSGLPAAGVGCAFARTSLVLLALDRADGPFHADSLTEDYELGMILGAAGGVCRFVEAVDDRGDRIAVRSEFPAALEACVRQKSRWIAGIAFAGWDRLRWSGHGTARTMAGAATGARGWCIRWMLWRDRRAPLAACIILCAYLGLILSGIDRAAALMGWWSAMLIDPALAWLIIANGALMAWRLGMRMVFTGAIYGPWQGVLAIPRAFVGNVIHILAARRACALYLRQLRTSELVWDKTEHAPLAKPALTLRRQ